MNSKVLREDIVSKFNLFQKLTPKDETSTEMYSKNPTKLVNVLVNFLTNLKVSKKKYILILDGLDHVLHGSVDNILAIGSLIRAARDINEAMFLSHIDAKVILIIRDDMTKMIPDPDLAKRLNDNGICLHWYQRVNNLFQTGLFSIIKRRAELAGYKGNMENIWREWMPERIYGRHSALYFLERTRFLPRDLISFLKVCQSSGRTTPLDEKIIIEAEKIYSDWLYEELYDSVAGIIPQRIRESLSSIFTELGRYFSVEQLSQSLVDMNLDKLITADHLANILYETHWIGNYWQNAHMQNIYVFKSRQKSSGFSPHVMCVLQLGLIKGLNLNLSFRGRDKR